MEATLMKVFGVISTTALFLLLGATIPAFAQEEHHEEAAKPAKQEAAKPAKQEEAKPEKQESQAKPAKQEEQAKAKPEKQTEGKPANQEKQANPAKQEEQAKSEKPAKQAKPVKAEKQAQPAKQGEQAKSEKQEGRGSTAEQHGQPQRSAEAQEKQRSQPALRLSARSSGRIPDDRFRANFGAEHVFVINQPVMVGGFSRFQYGGFWFGFENPWPEGWYYTDNVYVDYIDGGYYLCNPYYPGVHVGISVVI
jgi:outer membrane biosynthesis protein TonB